MSSPPNRVLRAARGVSDALEEELNTGTWSHRSKEQFQFDCGVLVGYALGKEEKHG